MEVIKSVLKILYRHRADIISLVSLLIAIFSLVKSTKAQKLQNKINELELEIKKNEADKISKEKANESKALVEARIINLGRDQYRMKVWNSGKASAYNVIAEFDSDNGLINIESGKMPFEILEPNKNFEMKIIVYPGAANKFKIKTKWLDDKGIEHEKTQMGDI